MSVVHGLFRVEPWEVEGCAAGAAGVTRAGETPAIPGAVCRGALLAHMKGVV